MKENLVSSEIPWWGTPADAGEHTVPPEKIGRWLEECPLRAGEHLGFQVMPTGLVRLVAIRDLHTNTRMKRGQRRPRRLDHSPRHEATPDRPLAERAVECQTMLQQFGLAPGVSVHRARATLHGTQYKVNNQVLEAAIRMWKTTRTNHPPVDDTIVDLSTRMSQHQDGPQTCQTFDGPAANTPADLAGGYR